MATARLSARMPTSRALSVGYATQSAAYLATGAALLTSAPYAVVVVLAAVAAVAVTSTGLSTWRCSRGSPTRRAS